ncbi:hypothetical protein MHYP_G00319310 [Metynnis hypsauchen]
MTAVGGKTELVPKKGVTSSVVWNWFGFAATDADQTSPRCKVCFKTVVSKGSSTTNLFQHLKQRHAAEWEKSCSRRSENSRNTSTPSKVKQATVPDTFLNCVPYDKNGARWKVITDAVALFIAKDMVPIYTVEKSGFINMLKVLDQNARVPGIQIIWTHNKMSMMEMTEEATLVDGKFKYKKLPDGSTNKNTVIRSLCRKEFAYHRSTSALRYHLTAEHVGASAQVSNDNLAAKCIPSTSKQSRQSTLDRMSGFKLRNKMSKSTSDKLTNSLARWIAVDCRPLSVVEDKGLQEALQTASAEASYELPSRKTMSKKIQQLYDEEREVKQVIVKSATNVALTGDHWTSVSNKNYLGVTAHIIDDEWKIQSFALSMQKTTSRHYGHTMYV